MLPVRKLDCRFDPALWPFAQENAAAIDANWQRLTELNPHLFNGEVLVLRDHRVEGDVFRGTYIRTNYKAFLGWRDSFTSPDRFRSRDTDISNGFAMAALRSADGAFLLGEMASHTANAGKIYFAAGTPDPSDIIGDTVDLAASALRELEEETGIGPTDYEVKPGWTVVVEGRRIAFMRAVTAYDDAVSLKLRIEATLPHLSEQELSRMHIVRSEADLDDEHMPLFLRTYIRSVFAGERQQRGAAG